MANNHSVWIRPLTDQSYGPKLARLDVPFRRQAEMYRWMNDGGHGGSAVPSFTFTIDTENVSTGSSASDHFVLPLVSTGTYDFNVDWGDSSDDDITAYDQAEIDHTYSVAGEYTITITGTIIGWRFNNTGDRLKMLDVSEWGPLTIGGTTNGSFYGCTNLTSSASDIPQLAAGVTNCLNMFRSASSFNADVSEWDVSSATNFRSMFKSASSFNADLSEWDVSSGENFSEMFRSASSFNADVSEWDVSSATNFTSMFRNASSFAADLSAWDVSAGTNFAHMFRECSVFNADLGGWDVSAGTNFSNFMLNANALSTANYDAILIGWEALDLVDSLSCHFGDATYSAGAAATARGAIIADDSWTITDGGPA